MIDHEKNVMLFAQSQLREYWTELTGESDCNIEFSIDLNKFNIKDNTMDDAFSINIVEGEGKIIASNGRSLVLAVYKLVEALGVRFLYPTKEGEIIPKVNKRDCTIKQYEVASYRHRGVCIEGAVSLEHVINMIDWSAKIGFNTYFVQFREGHNFFERWYTHENNPHAKTSEYTVEKSREYMDIIIREIKKRGMNYQAVGHGWTCEVLGIPSYGWYKTDDNELSEEKRNSLAMINGKRGFFEGIPLNTHLCYSQESVQQMFVDEVVSYTLVNKNIDIIHIWLADNSNNVCECEECQKSTISDFYISILNKIDRRLDELGNKTKIVFLIYLELLWTPEHERLINKDRFIMMFAPIHRTYTKSYLTDNKAPAPEYCKCIPYVLNKMKFPKDINSNLAFLYEWKKVFDGDSFLFDYHLMWDIYRDFANMGLSKVIYDDIVALDELNLNGLVSCQLQRAFFPNSIAMYVMGKTLFNKKLAYDDIVNEYMTSAYGNEYKFIREYLETVSELFSHGYARGDLPLVSIEVSDNYTKGVTYIEVNLPRIKYLYLICKDKTQKQMYYLLLKFSELMTDTGAIMARKSKGVSVEDLHDSFEKIKNKVWLLEPELNIFMDNMYFNSVMAGIIEDVVR